ncbi:MAG: methyltransferase domain-containing protein [Alphaproteobacteria bacterium]|nr:methyltransferase domain-containing protein [Alphaproteobacteria bacterium]
MRAAEALVRWNARFQGEDYLFGTAPNRFLAAQAGYLKPGQRALAIADGEGRNGVFLAQQGLTVLSVDFSPVALAKARRLAAHAGVELETECADLAEWTWGRERFDVIAGIFIQFADAPLRARLFASIREALKPGGLVLIQGYRPEQIGYGTGGPKELDHLYTAAMLRAAFAGFAILHLAEHDEVIREGSGHDGMSALVDLVARKPQTDSR